MYNLCPESFDDMYFETIDNTDGIENSDVAATSTGTVQVIPS